MKKKNYDSNESIGHAHAVFRHSQYKWVLLAHIPYTNRQLPISTPGKQTQNTHHQLLLFLCLSFVYAMWCGDGASRSSRGGDIGKTSNRRDYLRKHTHTGSHTKKLTKREQKTVLSFNPYLHMIRSSLR